MTTAPTTRWLARSRPHPRPESFHPTRSSLVLYFASDSEEETDRAFRLALFHPCTAVLATGEIIVLDRRDWCAFLDLAHAMPALPRAGFHNVWCLPTRAASEPRWFAHVPIVAGSAGANNNNKSTTTLLSPPLSPAFTPTPSPTPTSAHFPRIFPLLGRRTNEADSAELIKVGVLGFSAANSIVTRSAADADVRAMPTPMPITLTRPVGDITELPQEIHELFSLALEAPPCPHTWSSAQMAVIARVRDVVFNHLPPTSPSVQSEHHHQHHALPRKITHTTLRLMKSVSMPRLRRLDSKQDLQLRIPRRARAPSIDGESLAESERTLV